MIANVLLMIILHFHSLIINHAFNVDVTGRFGRMLWISALLGFLYGVCIGVFSYYLDRKLFKTLSLGKVILFKTLVSVAPLAFTMWLLRFVLFDSWISPTLPITTTILNTAAWDYLLYLVTLYYLLMTMLLSFINQVNKKYGPGVLVPLLLGRYRIPKEEERIFMFMDLKSSTSTAEQLGHLKYSLFIHDCFADINEVLYPFYAQVYQYVGDEIVVTWPASEGLKKHSCVKFFFACRRQFQRRSDYYLENYGFLPVFKAGMHMGTVTVVEIGEFKRDIAYHGDTLNTCARIQSVCNEFEKEFLVSQYLLTQIGKAPGLNSEWLGPVSLKGKTDKVELVSVTEL